MQLSWPRSPAAASTAASGLIMALFTLSLAPRLVSTADLDFQPILLDTALNGANDAQNELGDVYEPEFSAFDRSLIGRAAIPEGVRNMQNNVPETWQINVGETYCYVVEKDTLVRNKSSVQDTKSKGEELQPRQAGGITEIMLSATMCLQPHPKKENQKNRVPPQLTLFYVDGVFEDCLKGADKVPNGQKQTFEEGLAQLSLSLEKYTYVGISAPNDTDFQDVYNFEIAASKDDWYHSFDESSGTSAELWWMDSDSSAALLQTRNLTLSRSEVDMVMSEGPVYELFVQNDDYKVFNGISRSVCAMKTQALIHANKRNDGRLHTLVNTTMTTRGPGGFPKQQFYFDGLNSTSSYSGVLLRTKPLTTSQNIPGPGDKIETQSDDVGPGNIGGGGTVYEPLNFRTSAGQSCKVITDLEFCDNNQYAVPGRPDMDGAVLAKKYDTYAKEMYENFEKVIAQIQCETDSTSRYSLARGCDDCKTAYKRWLCTVSFPRCEDMTSNNTHAVIRNIEAPYPNGSTVPQEALDLPLWKHWNKASRNAFIDKEINPGPYKEILPCEDICYEVVQACHAAIGFTCPRPKSPGFEGSYGRRHIGSTELTCNYPGEPRTKISGAMSTLPSVILLVVVLAMSMML